MQNDGDIRSWIDALPDPDEFPASPPTKLKRKATQDQPPSPPATVRMDMDVTPTSKRQRRNSPDATPRLHRDGLPRSPTAASVSDSNASSKQSRSSSPLKKQIMSLQLDDAGLELRPLTFEAPPNREAARLLSVLRDIGSGLEFLPDDRRDEVLDSPMVKGAEIRPWRFAFTSASRFETLPGRFPSPEEVASVYKWAGNCSQLGHEEAGWNQEVHHRLLEATLRSSEESTESPFDFTSCTTARLHRSWIPRSAGPKMVDFSIYLAPGYKNAPSPRALKALCRRTATQSVNHTDFKRLQLRPIVLSIETKSPGQRLDTAEVQMGIWHATQWSFLRSALLLAPGRTEAQADEALSRLPLIPAVIVQGHKWLFVMSTREGPKTIFWTERQFGSTQSILETYQTVMGLRQLTAWAETVYLPWFKAEVLTPLGGDGDDENS
ncbi:hypothetical protein AUP68_17044 [Ilyonectria robusta]